MPAPSTSSSRDRRGGDARIAIDGLLTPSIAALLTPPLPFGTAPSLLWYTALAAYVAVFGFTLDPRPHDSLRNFHRPSPPAQQLEGAKAIVVPSPKLDTSPYAAWVHTHWIRVDRDHQSSESVLALVDDYARRGIPVGAVSLDAGWADRGTMRLNRTRFPDPSRGVSLIATLQQRGVRVVVYATALVREGTSLFNTAVDKGYCLRRSSPSSSSNVDASLVTWDGGKSTDGPGEVQGCLADLTISDVASWWHREMLDDALRDGVDGFKNDAVDVLFDQLGGGGSARTAIGFGGRAVSQAEWSRAYYLDFFDYAREGGKHFDRVTSFRPVDSIQGSTFRSFGPPEISFVCWVGNHPASFNGLRASLMNAIQSSYRGYVNFGVTVGGSALLGPATADAPKAATIVASHRASAVAALRRRELFVRWAQLAAYAPFLENGGLRGLHEPWVVGCDDPAVVRCSADADEQRSSSGEGGSGDVRMTVAGIVYKHTVRLHRALIPYFLSTATAAFYHDHDDGVARPPAINANDKGAAVKATTDGGDSAGGGEDPWSPSVNARHPPFYPLARNVVFAEPEDFAFVVGRDVFVVPITQHAPTLDAADAVVSDVDSFPMASHDLDQRLVEALSEASGGAARLSFRTPGAGVWVDPASDHVSVFKSGTSFTVRRNLTQGPLVLLRAGAVIPVGPRGGVVGWQLRAAALEDPDAASSTSFDSLTSLLGVHVDLLERRKVGAAPAAFTTDHPVVPLLIVNPLHAATGSDSSQVYREHDGGIRIELRVEENPATGTSRASPATTAKQLRLRYSAFHHPILFSIRGVQCAGVSSSAPTCEAPDGFEMVSVAEFVAIVEGAAGAGPVEAQRPVMAVVARETMSTVLLYDSAPMTGQVVRLGPFRSPSR